jgi:sugar phosphate isomerase/epimerase
MNDQTRRSFLKLTGIAAAASSVPLFTGLPAHASEAKPGISREKHTFPFTIGMASYTFRSFTLDQTIAMTKRLGLKKLTLKEMHLPLTSSDQEIQAAVEKIRQAELELDSCGVVYMKTEQEVAQAFAYAKKAGMKMIVGGPEPGLLPVIERFVKETDIRLAIHNHGPTDKYYPAPADAFKAVAKMDKRMGLCIDIAHTQRINIDPTAQFTQCFDRVFDIHIKDTSASDKSGTTVEIGRGVIDVPRLLREAVRLNYSGTFHYEHEKDQRDPLAGVAESVGYVNGVLAMI